jgi:hypothetical protein
MWRSLVAHAAGGRAVAGSSPVIPTRNVALRWFDCSIRPREAALPYRDPDRQRAFQRAWIKRRREEWIAANGPCIDCGSTERLEVDHESAASKVSHRIWSWSESRRLAELAKCVVRCRPCHEVKMLIAGEYRKNQPAGARHWLTSLTDAQVREMRALRKGGMTYVALASRFEVGLTTAKDICARRTWKYV